MELLLVFTAIIVILATILYFYFTRTFNHWKDKGVPGPKPIAFFGNLLESTLRKKNIGIVIKEIYDAFPNEKIVGVYRMTTPCLLIRDLDIVKHVMIKDFDNFMDRGIEFSKEGLGMNLFHADGDTWRVLRNRFTPIFTSGKLKNMLHLINERGDLFMNYIDEICQKPSEHTVLDLVKKFTTATISACAFGLNVDTQHDEDVIKTLEKLDRLLFTVTHAEELDMMYPGILKKINVSLYPTFVGKFFYGLARDVITQRKGLPSKRNDFMDLILQLKQQGTIEATRTSENHQNLRLELTEHVIAAQAFVFYAAGYETSANTMAHMLYELAKHPDIQDKVIDEIKTVLEQHNGEITYEAIEDMTYLDKVFDETLRLHPVGDPLIRKAQVDYKIPGCNVTIKKGTSVLISTIGIQHDEKYYPDPLKFDPERHSPEKRGSRHPCAYLPFGLGPRNCIGMRFAKVQSRVCMIKFLSKFRVEPTKNTPENVTMSPTRVAFTPEGGIPLNIVRQS